MLVKPNLLSLCSFLKEEKIRSDSCIWLERAVWEPDYRVENLVNKTCSHYSEIEVGDPVLTQL